MKNIYLIVAILAIVVPGLGSAEVADNAATKATVITSLTSMPLAFTQNQGQWDERVMFRANAGGATMWFTKNGAYYQFTRRTHLKGGPPGHPVGDGSTPLTMTPARSLAGPKNVTLSRPGPTLSGGVEGLHVGRNPCGFDNSTDRLETMMIKADFVGSNPNPSVAGEGLLDYKCNYFLGNDPDKWRTDVPNYTAIVYQDIYPGIDLKYYGNGKQMEYDFIVSPGADPSQIAVRYEGARSLSIDAAGRLVVETEWGTVTELKPFVYQLEGSERTSVTGEYTLASDNTFGFRLKDGYNPKLALVIDPTLEYSTYLGGSGEDRGWGIAVDASGAAYVTGQTNSSDFPTQNAYSASYNGGEWDVFVTKLSSSGSALEYSTYLGGSDVDEGLGIAVDGSGCAYVTGRTNSSNFPTQNAYDSSHNGYDDVFVTKLSSSGNALAYSTYLGGSSYDKGKAIAVDGSGCAYVTGWLLSSNFPTQNAYDSSHNGGTFDVLVTKMSSSGSALEYSTYLGGSSDDQGRGIAVDGSGCAYVAGRTNSSNFPTQNPYDASHNGYDDVFTTKLSSSGSALVYSTYLGGSDWDDGYAIAVDGSGCAYVTGRTGSSDFPTQNAYDASYNGNNFDAFVAKLSSLGNALEYSTYLGGSADECGFGFGGIAVDGSGCAYVAGRTISSDFPTQNAYDASSNGSWDVFATMLSSSGNTLVYSTYLGGSEYDYGSGIAVDAAGAAYVTGFTYSPDFPTLNEYQTYQGPTGFKDVFVTKLAMTCCNGDGIRGNVDGITGVSGEIDIADLTYLVAFLFQGGTPPPCEEEGNVDSIIGVGGPIDIADLTWLVAYLFQGGSAPPACP